MPRLLLVSNRLPVTITLDHGRAVAKPSAGGLATGLWEPHQQGDGLWFGWPGDVSAFSPEHKAETDRELAGLRTVPLYLSQEEYSRYYEGFSNAVIWPLCHYQIDKVRIDSQDFGVYQEVNRRMADVVVSSYQPGDTIWVHDYHLLLLPELLRERLPDVKIGFFLHIPFPSYEVFRILPWREQILRGMLNADLIGFHTHSYMRHFANSVLGLLGIESRMDSVEYNGHRVRLGAFPMGIDAESFASMSDSEAVRESAKKIRGDNPDLRLFVAVDRLDYTKGIPRRLQAFERFLDANPGLQETVRLVQVAVPSRDNIGSYQTLRRRVDQLLGRINSRFATPTSVPIHPMYRSLDRSEVVALYRAADVMLVTPIRDGLNLVAKEFCASRTDEDGVLILSEFAGAAAELGEAMRVNPYDLDQVADAMKRALEMSPDERQARMHALRRRVFERNVHDWCRSFRQALQQAGNGGQHTRPRLLPRSSLDRMAEEIVAHEPLHLLIDYDGTLVPFAIFPAQAAPDAEVLRLLEKLATNPRTFVSLLSGRLRGDMERWFGQLPVTLCAEHGLWLRPAGSEWTATAELHTDWKDQVTAIMEEFTRQTPGSFVETKTASVAWHYRNTELAFGSLQANELRVHLIETMSNLPVQVLEGEKVIEVRLHGVDKGTAARRIIGEGRPGTIVALGDDRTDEDMFAALPEGSYSIHVGFKTTQARYRLATFRDARALLGKLAEKHDLAMV
jgi:trehalose 6-phosphate synthase/phosphatase